MPKFGAQAPNLDDLNLMKKTTPTVLILEDLCLNPPGKKYIIFFLPLYGPSL